MFRQQIKFVISFQRCLVVLNIPTYPDFNAATIHTAGRMYRQIRHVHMANGKIVLRREQS